MGLKDDYIAIFDELDAVATTLQYDGNDAFKSVVQGWKTGVSTFPMCFILPDPDSISPASVGKDKHVFRFILAVVTESGDVEAGLKDSISRALTLYEQLVGDRKLNAKADNLEVTDIEFHWRKAPAFIRHWTALFVEIHRFYV